jgi:hypothetical protein
MIFLNNFNIYNERVKRKCHKNGAFRTHDDACVLNEKYKLSFDL